ncbi:MAG TPA: glycosyltransferase family 2 protein [Candidatus Blautia excrementipullorum]|nr:glycosyltransferase family 2 protein [Candidatus Blautia excrementipullorum]
MSVLSVVLPAYNEELMIAKTCRVLRDVLGEAGISYELVLVDDGSKDSTWKEIQKAGEKDACILGVHFSRNFGKEAAIFAGLAHARGDVVAVMDCDLQHPPETLKEMYRLWREGYQVIEGVKKSRGKESILHKECAGFFYGIMSKATGVNMRNTSDFKMMDRQVVESILSMPERNMFFRATSSWVGYRTAFVEFEVQEREAGQSKWSSWSLIKYAFTNIVAFTTLPLQFVTVGGVICFLLSLLLIIYSLIQYFTGHAVEGYTTIVMVMLLLGSAVMVSLGIIGYYIAKIYEEVKRRPRYIISKIVRGGRENRSCLYEQNKEPDSSFLQK